MEWTILDFSELLERCPKGHRRERQTGSAEAGPTHSRCLLLPTYYVESAEGVLALFACLFSNHWYVVAWRCPVHMLLTLQYHLRSIPRNVGLPFLLFRGAPPPVGSTPPNGMQVCVCIVIREAMQVLILTLNEGGALAHAMTSHHRT